MTNRQAGAWSLGVFIAGLVAASATGQTGEAKARPLLVGIVDLGVVLTRYERTTEILREVEREKTRMAKKADEQKKVVADLEKNLEGMRETTPQWQEKSAELKLAQKALAAMQEESEAIARHRFETLTLQVIDEIDEAVRDFAKKNHYDLILKTTTKGWGETKLPERIYRAQVSTVVAYEPALDVTEAILAHVNATKGHEKKMAH